MNVWSGKCLAIPNGNSTSGIRAIQWDCANDPDQQWILGAKCQPNRHEVRRALTGAAHPRASPAYTLVHDTCQHQPHPRLTRLRGH
ncbi:RICIN domain-containing protein [Kribbella sp. NPDC003505]|uniref:RICIN domain-containing protein n=1 Tax=Kribbella sp. NPDC003505 TaxID=3154448 RepID=UPI0033A7C215